MAYLQLQTHSSTRTTVSYTVTSSPSPTSPIVRVLRNTFLAIRLCLAALCCTAALLQLKLALGSSLFSSMYVVSMLETMMQEVIVQIAGLRYGALGEWWWALVLAGAGLGWVLIRRYYVEAYLPVNTGNMAVIFASTGWEKLFVMRLAQEIRRSMRKESLLVIRGLGIQTASSAATYLAKPSVRFIATSQIQDIFIHEAFIGFEVRFYLAVVVEGEEKAVVVFPKSLPRREILEQVWRGAREVLEWNRGRTK